MRVLLLGATGNLGLRLIPLLAKSHSLYLYIRNPAKLRTLLSTYDSPNSASLLDTCTLITGDAKDSSAISSAVLDNNIDTVINCAGIAKVFPWQKGDINEIFASLMKAVAEVGEARRGGGNGKGAGGERALRVWVLGGMGVLRYPGEETGMLSDYIPIYLEHKANLALLKTLPKNIEWSMLCPATMVPAPSTTSTTTLATQANTLPLWQNHWLEYIPIIGKRLLLAARVANYEITLEDAASFIAQDLGLEGQESKWVVDEMEGKGRGKRGGGEEVRESKGERARERGNYGIACEVDAAFEAEALELGEGDLYEGYISMERPNGLEDCVGGEYRWKLA